MFTTFSDEYCYKPENVKYVLQGFYQWSDKAVINALVQNINYSDSCNIVTVSIIDRD